MPHSNTRKPIKKSLKVKRLFALCLVSLVFMGITGCQENEKKYKRNSLPETRPLLKIAVGYMIVSSEGLAYYKQLLDYVGEKIGGHVKLVEANTYTDVNNLLKSGEVDVAFICGKPYVDGHDEFGLELLVAPMVNGKAVYYSYIIVPRDSPVKTFEELRGKAFAFADPESNSGKLVPAYMLAEMNETPDTFFRRHKHTFAHGKSIWMVAEKMVDGAAIDSLVWDFYSKIAMEVTSKTKIIFKSPPHGIPPVVVSSGIDPEIKNRLRKIFLGLHEDEKSKKILDKMMIDKFVVVSDSQYDSIREMMDLVEQKNKSGNRQ